MGAYRLICKEKVSSNNDDQNAKSENGFGTNANFVSAYRTALLLFGGIFPKITQSNTGKVFITKIIP